LAQIIYILHFKAGLPAAESEFDHLGS